MKRLFYLFVLATAIVVSGCTNQVNEPPVKTADAIKGHTYMSSDGTNYIKFYFASNYVCVLDAKTSGQDVRTSNLTYVIDGNNVDIYRDNSTYWQEHVRGTLVYHMIYYPADDVLMLEDFIFERVS